MKFDDLFEAMEPKYLDILKNISSDEKIKLGDGSMVVIKAPEADVMVAAYKELPEKAKSMFDKAFSKKSTYLKFLALANKSAKFK